MSEHKKRNLESLLYMYYIKYDELDRLTRSLFNKNISVVDVYVDVADMVKLIYKFNVYSDKKFSIVSCVINLAAHLRNYFSTRHGLNTRIFLIYGNNFSKIDPSDCKLNYSEITGFIMSQLELVKILAAYIYNVYYVQKSFDFSVVAYDNILRNINSQANTDCQVASVLITKNKYAYQATIVSPCTILRPRKDKDKDISFIVNRDNALMKYYNKTSSQKTLDILSCINPEMLNLFMTFTGYPSAGIKSISNITSTSRNIMKAIEKQLIFNGYNANMDYLYDVLGASRFCSVMEFKERYRTMDLRSQHLVYINTPESRDTSWIINLDDKLAVQEINNKYFADNPLDLNAL